MAVNAQRITSSINEGWQFRLNNSRSEQTVNIPHVWSVDDMDDDTSGFERSKGTYTKILTLTARDMSRSLFIHIGAALQNTQVKVNGFLVGMHNGGYTSFCYEITDMVKSGSNKIEILVDNNDNQNLSASANLSGGIYRNISLISTAKQFISPTHYGSSGVYFSASGVSSAQASVNITTMLGNSEDKSVGITIQNLIYDASNNIVASSEKSVKLSGMQKNLSASCGMNVKSPKLWSIDNPYCYRLVTRVKKDGKTIDEVENTIGFRSYSFSGTDGFTLNGKRIKLIGTSRSQDYLNISNALSDEINIGDVRMIKDMGANYLSMSHHPHDALVTNACDRLGIVTSIGIPVINSTTLPREFSDNIDQVLKEMIYQNYNSPSVCIWTLNSDILRTLAYADNNRINKEQQLRLVQEHTKRLHTTAKSIDPTRATMIPFYSDYNAYENVGLFAITDILGFNNYDGWYQGEVSDFGFAIGTWHGRYPRKAIIINEFGAGNDIRLHSYNPERYDFSSEYACNLHNTYLAAILDRSYVSGCSVSSFNDSCVDNYGFGNYYTELMGLVTSDRKPKDTYYLYKAKLSKNPFISIAGKDWTERYDNAEKDGICTRTVTVFTNQERVTLSNNGKVVGTQSARDGMAEFKVPFVNGDNILIAKSDDVTDILKIKMNLLTSNLSNITELNVMLGTQRHYFDTQSNTDWMPEQEYTPGSWGYVGGSVYKDKALASSTANIDAQFNTPVFKTQRRALKSFRADIPDGSYIVYLYFCELDDNTARQFDVSINSTKVLPSLDVAASVGVAHSLIKRIPISVTSGKGITIDFTSQKGETMLSAVRIIKQ